LQWMEIYNQLISYKEQHNDSTNVPQTSKEYGRLGRWVCTQRSRYHGGLLSNKRITLLESIGFQWQVMDKNQWMKMYQRLVAYKEEFRTARVPQRYKADPQLGRWVNKQRTSGKSKKDRCELLNKIGFEWNISNPNDWENMYQRLLVYKKKHGTTCIPKKYKADPQLGTWVHTQRDNCKEKDRIELLNKIGFEWRMIEKNDWKKTYQRLVAYKEKDGTTRVPQSYKEDPHLGRWVNKQRLYCKQKNRVDLLNEIGFEWNVRDDWMQLYQHLVEYKKNNGTARVPQRYKNNPQLGRWVEYQRTNCKDKDRVDLLNDIGFDWNVKGKNPPTGLPLESELI